MDLGRWIHSRLCAINSLYSQYAHEPYMSGWAQAPGQPQPGPGQGPAGRFIGAQGKTLVKPRPRPGAMFLACSHLGPCAQRSKAYLTVESVVLCKPIGILCKPAQGEATVTRSNRSAFVYLPPYRALKSGFPYRSSPWFSPLFPVGTLISPWYPYWNYVGLFLFTPCLTLYCWYSLGLCCCAADI